MSIKTRLSNPTVDVLASDTVIFTVDAASRIAVSAFSCYAASATDVTFYSSPNNTSASGDILATKTFATDEEKDISEIIGQGFVAGRRIIAVGDSTGVNATMTYTLYDGDDI